MVILVVVALFVILLQIWKPFKETIVRQEFPAPAPVPVKSDTSESAPVQDTLASGTLPAASPQPIQADENLLKKAEDDLRHDYDSIAAVLDKKMQEGEFVYREQFQWNCTIALYQFSIQIQRKKAQVPEPLRDRFQQLGISLYAKLNKYVEYDERYPSYVGLYKEKQLSEEEYARLNKETREYGEEVKRLVRLLNEVAVE